MSDIRQGRYTSGPVGGPPDLDDELGPGGGGDETFRFMIAGHHAYSVRAEIALPLVAAGVGPAGYHVQADVDVQLAARSE